MSTLNVWIFFAIVTSLSLTAEVRSTTTSTEPEGKFGLPESKECQSWSWSRYIARTAKVDTEGGKKTS